MGKLFIVMMFLVMCASCVNNQCKPSILSSTNDIAIKIKRIEYNKTNKSFSLNLMFLGKSSAKFALYDIYDNVGYGNNLEQPNEHLVADSLASINKSKLIIQSCNGRWRYVVDFRQNERGENGGFIVILDRNMFMPNIDSVIRLKTNRIDSMSFFFENKDLVFENDRLPDKFRIILQTKDSLQKPVLLYSNRMESKDIGSVQ